MASRHVTTARVNTAGYVTHLGCEGESWSPRSARKVLEDIELGVHEYYLTDGGRHAEVDSATDAGGVYLSADTDGTARNNILDLPAC
ncbi:MAG: hypothetical protein JWQ43_1749 [Glaciihabitans sp.]|nr:hypothetical protein [Glaciihabitans sp.]